MAVKADRTWPPRADGTYPIPRDEEQFAAFLNDPMARICSGFLYKILIKSDVDATGVTKIAFIPNRAQRRFIRRLWTRNLVLKARQLGMTTLIAIIWLDHALFTPDQRCGIIAHDTSAAETIFRDKVKFAYENLPDALKEAMPLKRDSADELLFANNSSVRVATSMRSGTIHRLLVSEFGKICAKYPAKAQEVVTGSIPAVPIDGIVVIESTAEGQEGDFYAMAMKAIALAEARKPLTALDYRFHFANWMLAAEYQMQPGAVIISDIDHEYFDQLEITLGQPVSMAQRSWYVATREGFGGSPERIWQEYPSTPTEAFQKTVEGTYYAKQLAHARLEGRITTVPHVTGAPVYSFWDIGVSDGTGVWFMQHVGQQFRFIKYIEGWGEPYETFTRQMQATPYMWGTHFLPHDAAQKKQLARIILTPREMLENLWPGQRFEIVDAVNQLQDGIQAVRDVFSQCVFDETGCKEGLRHLSLYRKEWDQRVSAWKDSPRKDEHTESADSFRQFAQALKDGMIGRQMTRTPRARRGAMAL